MKMPKTVVQLLQEHHECRVTLCETTMPPECLSAEDGRCAVYEKALYCPKYGKPVGSVKRYGGMLVQPGTEAGDGE